MAIMPCPPEKRRRFVPLAHATPPNARKRRETGSGTRKCGPADADGARPFPVRAGGQSAGADKMLVHGARGGIEPSLDFFRAFFEINIFVFIIVSHIV